MAAPTPTIVNRRARHDYFIDESFECGIALAGGEVKSIRDGKANLRDAYARVEGGEVWLYGMHIAPYAFARTELDPERRRKLLLHRREIDVLIGRVQRDGYTLVPTALYWKGNKVKAELALAKGKQSHDKREAAKDRDWARDKQRVMRRHNRDA